MAERISAEYDFPDKLVDVSALNTEIAATGIAGFVGVRRIAGLAIYVKATAVLSPGSIATIANVIAAHVPPPPPVDTVSSAIRAILSKVDADITAADVKMLLLLMGRRLRDRGLV